MGAVYYIIGVFLSGGIALTAEKANNRKYYIICCAIIAGLWGCYAVIFRINPHFDRSRYIRHFYTWMELQEIGIPFYNIEYESGYVLLNYMIGFVSDHAGTLIFITMFLTVFLSLYSICLMNRKLFICVVFFLSTAFVGYGLSVYKQVLAAALGNLAFSFYMNRKYLCFVLFVVLATSFQAISIIYLGLFLMFWWCDRKWKYMFVILAFAIFFIRGSLITTILRFIPYLETYIPLSALKFKLGAGSMGAVLKGLPFYIITAVSFIYRKRLKAKIYNGDALIFMSMFASIAHILAYNMYWAFRMSFYALIPVSILAGDLWRIVPDKYGKLLLMICLFLLYCTSLRYILLIEV